MQLSRSISLKKSDRQRWILGNLAIFYLTVTSPANCQIIPDATLRVNTLVTPEGNTSVITGGTTAGINLFHSFKEFSVPTGNAAYFNNASDIQNIITRVTGGKISNIDGTLKANGSANLFLINPNGIIFGPNAQLNIGGSFFASSANSIKFADGSTYSATNPEQPPLLTINVPIGLQFGQNPGKIVNNSRVTATAADGSVLPVGLQVLPEKTLALIGGDIHLEGGNLAAPAGRIELGSVKDSFVSINPIASGFALSYQNATKFGDIQLSGGASVNTSGTGGGSIHVKGSAIALREASTLVANTLGNVDGSGINIQATQLSLADDSFISTTTLGEGIGGDITVSATEKVELTGSSLEKLQQTVADSLSKLDSTSQRIRTGFYAGSFGKNAAGDINIDTPILLLQNGAAIDSNTFSSARAGNLNIRAANSVELVGSALSNAALPGSAGASGSITIDTQRLIVRDASYIASTTFGSGKAGNITITASESVELLRSLEGSVLQTIIASNSFGTGNAGDITIDTQRLIIRDGAGITSSSGGLVGSNVLRSGGLGGSLMVRASEQVEVSGVSEVLANGSQISSFLTSATFTPFAGGNLSISTGQLTVKDGGLISTGTLGAGKAGDLTINAAQKVEISGASGQFRSTIEASSGTIFAIQNIGSTGDGGSVILTAPQLIVKNGALLNVSSLGSGKSGILNIVSPEIRLENEAALNASTASGGGGNIVLNVRDLQLRRGSQINTNAGNTDGGNVTIATKTLAALEDSDITANAQQGRGGRVIINARGIFGTDFRDKLTPASDITATSELGAEFSGTVQIVIPDINAASGLVEVQTNSVDVTSSLGQNACAAFSKGSSFIITGKGGLPPNPTEPLSNSAVIVDWATLEASYAEAEASEEKFPIPQSSNPGISNPPSPIVEATGFAKSPDGKVVLTANPTTGTSHSAWYRQADCSRLR